MASIETKLEQNYLQCSICCDQFTKPRVLNCQHSFCHKCLEGCLKASKENSIKCAICRKKTTIPRKGLREIPENFMIVSLLQMLKDSKISKSKATSLKPTTSKKTNAKPPTPKVKTAAPKVKTPKSISTAAKNAKAKQALPALSKKVQLKSRDINDNKQVATGKVNRAKAKEPTSGKSSAGCCKEKSKINNKPCQKSKCFKINVRVDESFSSEDSMEELTPNDDSSTDSDSDSSEFESDSNDSNSSEYTDTSYEVLSGIESSYLNSNDDSDSSSEDDCPPTPHLQSFMGINVSAKVLVFTEKGKICKGTVRVLEKFKRKPNCLSAVYAGVELQADTKHVTTADLNRDMHDSYLYSWINMFDKPCTVVRVDQCCPTSFYDSVAATIE